MRNTSQFAGIRSTVMLLGVCLAVPMAQAADAPQPPDLSRLDGIFENYRLDAHVPGMVFGVVRDGRLAYVKGLGVQDLEAKRPVTAETLFRIASMTKAFTALSILKLRDDGRLSLDAPAERYVPEMRTWRYPTLDSPRIRVRELLTHTAGFVTDDPWGDRQTPMPEADFSRLLRAGVPFTRAPGMAHEYSNFGYALLGHIVANVSQQPYAEFVRRTLLDPLGMSSTGYDVTAAPQERRALGYRWEDGAWKLEPTMGPGAFGPMGGIQTSANDYAKWLAFLLSAWPPRDDADAGPVRRSSVRELAQGANFPRLVQRYGSTGADACRQAWAYGMGMRVSVDCELGFTLHHSGGYPGYGSHVALLTDYGVAIFAFANRTYSAPTAPVWDAAMELLRSGQLEPRVLAVSPALAAAYAAAGSIFAAGSVTAAGDVLAMNVLMDRDADHWTRLLADLKTEVGACETTPPITATGLLSGSFTWRCERGRVKGSLLLAPTSPPSIQRLSLTRIDP